MQAEKAIRGQHPSTSLRTSEKSTTRLSDSAKLMGTLTHKPDATEEGASISMQLPGDGTTESLSVRPATKNAVQVFGSLSRVGKKLRDSQEAQANKRTQSQAGIDQEDGDHRSTSKRLRTSDPDARRGKSHGNPHVNLSVNPDANPYGYPGNPPAPQAVSQSVAPPVAQPAVKPPVKPTAQPVNQPVMPSAVQPASRPNLQAVKRVIAVPPAPVFEFAPEITPDMQAQIAMAEALRLANSTMRFQPEKISELFQHLCRAQLWPLLRLEEQRALYLMDLQRAMQAHDGMASVPGAHMDIDADASSSTTTTMTTQPIAPTPIPVAETASPPTRTVEQKAPQPSPNAATRTPARNTQPAHAERTEPVGSNASKIQEHLIPDAPNPQRPDYAQGLFESVTEGTQLMMKMSAEEIRNMLGRQKLDLATINNMTAFTCLLVEITSHGGLPHLDNELDSIVKVFLQRFLTSHRHREPENKARGNGDTNSGKIRVGKDPAFSHFLRLSAKYPQFARALGIGLNNLQVTHRTHLGISRKFNAVLALMKERRTLSSAEFASRLDKIVDDASPSQSSATATTASRTVSMPTSTSTNKTTSTPTSARTFQLEGGEDEGSDGEI